MSESPQLNPTALTIEQASKVLTATYREPVSIEMIKDDVDAGAPTNTDGTINLVHYGAWLVKELGRGD